LVRTKSEKKLEILPTTKKHLTGFQNLSGVIVQQFSNFFNSYSKAYNKMYDRNGSLFQRPFKVKEILSDSYLTKVIIYIHHNPGIMVLLMLLIIGNIVVFTLFNPI